MRREEGAADGSIKYELAILRQAFNLAHEADKIQRVPSFPKIKLENIRTEFFDPDEFERLKGELPDALRGLVEFAYLTGWRITSEVLPLNWHQVDFKAGVVRLEPGTTKSGKGRTFPFAVLPELKAVLESQRAYTDEIERLEGRVVPLVFHRDGKGFKDIRWLWRAACKRAGVLGADGRHKVPHDFRRTAVRRLERAGVPRSVAMKLVGHETESIYQRYAIVAEQDLAEGVAKLAQFTESCTPGKVLPFREGQLRGQSSKTA